jgi:hypothetical protein
LRQIIGIRAKKGKRIPRRSEGLHLFHGLLERRRKAKEHYLGPSHKMSREEAQERAKALKREALGLSPITSPESGN